MKTNSSRPTTSVSSTSSSPKKRKRPPSKAHRGADYWAQTDEVVKQPGIVTRGIKMLKAAFKRI